MVKRRGLVDHVCVLLALPDPAIDVGRDRGSRSRRVYLCDDVPEFRALLRLALEGDDALTVVGEAGDGESCVAGVLQTEADVVLLDLAMPCRDGLQAIPLLRELAPRCAILVLSGFDAGRMAPQVLAAGASGYIAKGDSFASICRKVREVSAA